MTRLRFILLAVLPLAASPALANVPVKDAALLTRQSETAGVKVKLLPITTQRRDANRGVNCAVTTGKKANVADPTVQPQVGAGARTIQPYSPESRITPNGSARGAALSKETLFQSAGTVVGGIDASRSTLQAAQGAFRTAGQQAGIGETVMAALDMNSAARLQNNLAWNQAINSANLWVTAINALNLARNSDVSRAAGGMRATTSARGAQTGTVCPIGMIGSGTAADPCRSPSTCQTTAPGVPPDPACVSPRYVDAAGNVLFFLEQIQNAAAVAATRP